MPTGSPDFGQNPTTNPTSPSFDSGEDATRLLMGGGSMARSGRWIYADGFESGSLNPFYLTGIGSYNISIFKTNSFQGVNSLLINPGTNANDAGYLSKSFLLPGSKTGIEFMFAMQHGLSLNCEIQIVITGGGKGANKDKNNQGKIVLSQTTGKINKLYWDVNGTRTELKDVSYMMQEFAKYWHYVKFVYDMDNNKGVRLFFDDLTFDLSGLSGYQTSGTAPINNYTIIVKNLTNAQSVNFIFDNYVITTDEP